MNDGSNQIIAPELVQLYAGLDYSEHPFYSISALVASIEHYTETDADLFIDCQNIYTSSQGDIHPSFWKFLSKQESSMKFTHIQLFKSLDVFFRLKGFPACLEGSDTTLNEKIFISFISFCAKHRSVIIRSNTFGLLKRMECNGWRPASEIIHNYFAYLGVDGASQGCGLDFLKKFVKGYIPGDAQEGDDRDQPCI